MITLNDRSEDLLHISPDGVSGSPPSSCCCPVCTGDDWRYVGQTWGMAVADVDGDGWLDLYVNHHTEHPAELTYAFASDEPAHETVVSRRPGTHNDQHSAVFFDIDQDGDLDLMEARGGERGQAEPDPDFERNWNQLYLNESGELTIDGHAARDFNIDYGPARGRTTTALNVDGKLALYFGVKAREVGDYGSKIMRQTSDGSYRDWNVIFRGQKDALFGIGTTFGKDASTDLLTYSRESIYIHLNVIEPFEHALVLDFPESRVEDVLIADFDNDRLLDMFVAQRGKRGAENAVDQIFTVNARNELIDRTEASGLSERAFETASATTGDFDNDGDVDIAALHIADGLRITFWTNDGTGHFTPHDYVDTTGSGRADQILTGDFNNDGWLDFMVASGAGRQPPDENRALGTYTLLEQEAGENNWLKVSLTGTVSEINGLGAEVHVWQGPGDRQMRYNDGGAHDYVQDSQIMHFGLGELDVARGLLVYWPDGSVQRLRDVPANQHIRITQGERGYEVIHGEPGQEPPEPAMDVAVGTSGDDLITALAGPSRVRGGAGEDTLFGEAGDDRLTGGRGADVVSGGDGDDLVFGGARGDDTVLGGGGADRVIGRDGNDVLEGGWGDDTISGGSSDDRILPGPGKDRMIGGAGADTFVLRVDGAEDRILDFDPQEDTIEVPDWLDIDDVSIDPEPWGTRVEISGDALLLRGVSGLSEEDFVFV